MASEDLSTYVGSSNKDSEVQSSGKKVGLVLAGITGGAAVILSVIAAPFVAPALRKICLPYVPATNVQVNNVLRALSGRSGCLVDLGSGDGRIVIAAAKNMGLHGVGVELNPWLVWYSRLRAWKSGVGPRTSFVTKDLWTINLQQYNNIVIFGVEEMMADLENKLVKELTSNGRIIACRFPLPSWKPISVYGEGIDTVWLYERPDESSENSSLPPS